MGTHIDGFFPHDVERSLDKVRTRLHTALSKVSNDLDVVRAQGWFSAGNNDWWLCDTTRGVEGEGPSGLSILVCRAVVLFTSVERFGAIQYQEQGIHNALRRVFDVVASEFGADGRLAVAAGGIGDTDRAFELAIAGAEFADICECLEAVIGPPARNWDALEADSGNWYLSPF